MKNKRIHQSSGVTIIEVLFSIGIIVTGLLGVAGLIMIAGTQMTQGLEADAMSNAGLNAIAEFETRNMQNPDNLLWYKPGTKMSPSQLLFPLPDLYGTDSAGKRIASASFCIDPYFITQQFADGKFDTSSYFPGRAPPGLNMKRVTLNNMSLPLSREIFIAKDDLAFSTPASGTELPEQQWIREGLDETTPRLKRANRAAYSWLAMLTPNRSRTHTRNPLDPTELHLSDLEPTDHYLLSIVVFKNRVVTNSNDGEILFNITFNSDGLGGGEVALYPTDPDDLYPRHGDWIMLSAGSQIKNFHRWYRITYIEEETNPQSKDMQGNVIGPHRNATLQGPDWSRSEWLKKNSTQVTFIPGVIGVFEKTIRLGSARSY